jgi:hypothetical protein
MAEQLVKIFFAWIDDPDTDFDETVHNVVDESIYSLKFAQVEGDFASLELVIKNPRIGLLKTGRPVWAWLSVRKSNGVIVPMIRARIVGLPTNLFDTLVTLEFTARPTDFVEQKLALADTMKVLPYYDPIYISPDSWGDPDTVLEGRTVMWHIDPVTHVVTVSDVLVPEDGTIDLTEDQFFYDSMSITLDQVPLSSCTVTATIPWVQQAQGVVELTPLLFQFRDPDSHRDLCLTSFTMEGLISDWPKDGDSLGEGWVAINSSITDVSATAGKPYLTEGGDNAPIPFIFDVSKLPPMTQGSLLFPLKVTGEYHSGTGDAGFNFDYEMVGAQLGYARANLDAQYTRQSDFGQVVTFTITCDMQKIITLASDDQALAINLNANRVTDITEDGSVPLPDQRARDYVNTARGAQSVQHAILVGRANLVIRSRAVKTSFQMPFLDALPFTLRKGAFIHDHRLPGGEAGGKVIAYEFTLDGDTGEALATITFGSSIGYGGSHTPETNDPTYVEVGYVNDPYQFLHHGTTLLGTSDIQYSIDLVEPQDDGLNFQSGLSARQVVRSLTITDPSWVQRGFMEDAVEVLFGSTYGDQSQLSKILQDHPTQFSLLMRSMKQGPFSWPVPVTVSNLIIPKQIDLEADSA